MPLQVPNTFEEFNKLSDEDKLNHYLSLNDKQRSQLIPSDYEHGIVEVKPKLDSPNSQKFLKLYKRVKLDPDISNRTSDSEIPDDEKQQAKFNLAQAYSYMRGQQQPKTAVNESDMVYNGDKIQNNILAKRILYDMNKLKDNFDIDNEQRSILINARLNALRKLGKKIDSDEETGEFFFDN